MRFFSNKIMMKAIYSISPGSSWANRIICLHHILIEKEPHLRLNLKHLIIYLSLDSEIFLDALSFKALTIAKLAGV